MSANFDIFVARLRPDGVVVWSQRFGATEVGGVEYGQDLAVDAFDRVTFTAEIAKPVNFGGANLGVPNSVVNGQDIAVVRLTGAGAHVWSKRLTSTAPCQSGEHPPCSNFERDTAGGVAVRPDGTSAVGGSFSATVTVAPGHSHDSLGTVTQSKDGLVASFGP